MKTILTLLLAFHYFFSYSQSYKSVIENNDSIMILYDNGFFEGQTQNVLLKGDSIISDIKYTKLSFNGYWGDFFNEIICSPEFLESHNSECLYFSHNELFIREDSDKSKLYLYSVKSKREYLIMDLNLMKNDTFRIARNNEDTLSFYVDSFYFINGNKIIEFKNEKQYAEHGQIKLSFIEGIGPKWGLFYGFNEANNLLLCSYIDGNQTYIISEDSQCEYSWYGDEWPEYPIAIEEKPLDEIIKISNTKSNIQLQTNSGNRFDVAIYDNCGRLVFYENYIQNEINISLPQNQIYLIKMVIDNKIVIKKIVMQ